MDVTWIKVAVCTGIGAVGGGKHDAVRMVPGQRHLAVGGSE